MRDEYKAARRLYTVKVRTYISVEPPDYDPENPDLFPAKRTLLNIDQLVSEEVVEYSAMDHVVGQVIGMAMKKMAAATQNAAEVEGRLK